MDGATVPVAVVASRTEAELIVGMLRSNGLRAAVSADDAGGQEPQLQTQVLVNLVDHALDPAEALARPRVRIVAGGATVTLEADYPGAAEMARSEKQVQLMPAAHHTFGHAHAILIDGPGSWRAGADPRSDGSAESVH